MNGSVSEGEHTDVSVVLSIPLACLNEMAHHSNYILTSRSCFFLKIIAFISRIKPKDVLLFKNLKVVKHYNHSNFDVFFSIIEKKHEIYLNMLYWIRKSSCILCFAFELLS